MGTRTLYQCDEPGCTREGREGEESIMGWTIIPEAYAIGELILSSRPIALCPTHRPTWAKKKAKNTVPTK